LPITSLTENRGRKISFFYFKAWVSSIFPTSYLLRPFNAVKGKRKDTRKEEKGQNKS